MRVTTEAIVLGLHKRTDKLSVLQVYTEQEGMLQLQVYGANGKKKSHAADMPLAVVEASALSSASFQSPLPMRGSPWGPKPRRTQRSSAAAACSSTGARSCVCAVVS